LLMAIVETLARKRLQVTGVVQGVGFRPFIYRLARRHHLTGWVCNTSQCVEIEIEATLPRGHFYRRAAASGSGLGRIDGGEPAPSQGSAGLPYGRAATDGYAALIPADVATCADCLADTPTP
jgi:hydrogenase maturation protein HypF